MGAALFCLRLLALTAVLGLPGCAAFTPVEVAKPSDITLVNATTQVAESLVAMKQELDRNKTKVGLIVDQVDVDLAITAGATQGGSQDLKIDASKTMLAGVGLSADIQGSQTSTGQRSNTIHMTFKNIATASLNCIGYKGLVGSRNREFHVYAAKAAAANSGKSDSSGGPFASASTCK